MVNRCMLSTKGWIEKAGEIMKNLGVYSAYTYVRDTNPSNDLPYHNWTHLCHVVVNSSAGANYYALPSTTQTDIAVAAIFHDYDHSGGHSDDAENVDRAIQGFSEWNSLQKHPLWDSDSVTHLIRSTQHPPVVDFISIEQKILHDSDLMENGLDTWHEKIMNGVRYELEIKYGHSISYTQMLEMQLEFHDGVVWRTRWGQEFDRQYVQPNLKKIQQELQQRRSRKHGMHNDDFGSM